MCKETHEKPGYASPIAIEFDGIRQVVTMLQKSVVGVGADTGKLLWHQPHIAYADETISTPIFHDRFIFVSTLPAGASQCIELRAEGDRISATRAWQSKALANHHGGVVLVDGYIYRWDPCEPRPAQAPPWQRRSRGKACVGHRCSD